MNLSAVPLKNVNSVNYWEYDEYAHVYENQPNTVYLQLVNLSIDSECPRRYIPESGSGLTITFPSIDSDEEFEVIGSQPYSQDGSIWLFNIPSSSLPKSGAIKLKLTEGGVDKYFIVKSFVSTELLSIGGC